MAARTDAYAESAGVTGSALGLARLDAAPPPPRPRRGGRDAGRGGGVGGAGWFEARRTGWPRASRDGASESAVNASDSDAAEEVSELVEGTRPLTNFAERRMSWAQGTTLIELSFREATSVPVEAKTTTRLVGPSP